MRTWRRLRGCVREERHERERYAPEERELHLAMQRFLKEDTGTRRAVRTRALLPPMGPRSSLRFTMSSPSIISAGGQVPRGTGMMATSQGLFSKAHAGPLYLLNHARDGVRRGA